MPAVQTIYPQFVLTFSPGGVVTLQKVASGIISGVILSNVITTTNDIEPVKKLLDVEFAAQIQQELNQ